MSVNRAAQYRRSGDIQTGAKARASGQTVPTSHNGGAVPKAARRADLRQLMGISTAVEITSGAAAFHEGDSASALYCVARGAVRLSKLLPDGRRQVIGFVFPGEFFGLTVTGAFSCTAEAMTRSWLRRLDRGRLLRELDRYPQLERYLLILASSELAQAQEHLLVFGRKTATERVATLLLMLLEKIGKPRRAGYALSFPMTRCDLGDYLGLSGETVSRTLSELAAAGVIAPDAARDVYIPNLMALAKLTGDE